MTLIIGMKYNEGIVLIGDTKIMDNNPSSDQIFHHEKKIEVIPNHKIALAYAGSIAIGKDFSRKIIDIVPWRVLDCEDQKKIYETRANAPNNDVKSEGSLKQLQPNYIENKIFDECSILVKQLNDQIRFQLPHLQIFTIIASYLPKSSPQLYFIDSFGLKMDLQHVAIGSGSVHISNYLKNNYNPNLTINQAILLGTFLIKYIELQGLDAQVGVEKDKLPQILVLNKDFCGEYSPPNEEKKRILTEINKRIKKIKSAVEFTTLW